MFLHYFLCIFTYHPIYIKRKNIFNYITCYFIHYSLPPYILIFSFWLYNKLLLPNQNFFQKFSQSFQMKAPHVFLIQILFCRDLSYFLDLFFINQMVNKLRLYISLFRWRLPFHIDFFAFTICKICISCNCK